MTDFAARQKGLRALRRAGWVWYVAGAAAVLVGSVLAWVRFSVFGVEFSLPGVAGWGALTASCALLSLIGGRRFPLLGVLVGLLAMGIGSRAQQETGRAVRGRVLALTQALAPVNDKLMRVGLPPIEPFPLGQRWADHVGPGPLWTFWGGAALAVGAAAAFCGERLGRTCGRCGARWSPARMVVFCPACGERAGPLIACPACQSPLEPSDHFCAVCGSAASSD